jgi:hypothetical protein
MARKRKITWRASEPARQPDYRRVMARMRELEGMVEDLTAYFIVRLNGLEKRVSSMEKL